MRIASNKQPWTWSYGMKEISHNSKTAPRIIAIYLVFISLFVRAKYHEADAYQEANVALSAAIEIISPSFEGERQ